MLAFLDMDGVIADFVSGACKVHGRPNPYDDPKNHGVWEIDSLWGMTAREFWAPCNNNPDFWDNLEKTEDSDRIVCSVMRKFGEDNVAILTAPSLDPQCVPGKRRWIKKYFPEFTDRIIYTGAKKFLAGPDRVLIDDRSSNVENFRKAGGKAVLVPRLWNDAHNLHQLAAQRVNLLLENL